MRVKADADELVAFIPVRSGPPVDVTAQIEDETGNVVVDAVPAVVEVIPGKGAWVPTRVHAVAALPNPGPGDWLVHWQNTAVPTFEATVPLFVTA